MPQTVAPRAMRALPNPSNQGCLWGMVQGVLAGVLVLFMREAIYFELATVMGFAFYVLAGFTTTAARWCYSAWSLGRLLGRDHQYRNVLVCAGRWSTDPRVAIYAGIFI